MNESGKTEKQNKPLSVLILKGILVQNTWAQNSGMFQTFHFINSFFFGFNERVSISMLR